MTETPDTALAALAVQLAALKGNLAQAREDLEGAQARTGRQDRPGIQRPGRSGRT